MEKINDFLNDNLSFCLKSTLNKNLILDLFLDIVVQHHDLKGKGSDSLSIESVLHKLKYETSIYKIVPKYKLTNLASDIDWDQIEYDLQELLDEREDIQEEYYE